MGVKAVGLMSARASGCPGGEITVVSRSSEVVVAIVDYFKVSYLGCRVSGCQRL